MHRDAAHVQILCALSMARTLAHLLGERTSAPLCMTTARYSRSSNIKKSKSRSQASDATGQPSGQGRGAGGATTRAQGGERVRARLDVMYGFAIISTTCVSTDRKQVAIACLKPVVVCLFVLSEIMKRRQVVEVIVRLPYEDGSEGSSGCLMTCGGTRLSSLLPSRMQWLLIEIP